MSYSILYIKVYIYILGRLIPMWFIDRYIVPTYGLVALVNTTTGNIITSYHDRQGILYEKII